MSYSSFERETVIVCDDETKLCHIYSLQSSIITRLKRAGFVPYKIDSDGATYFKNIPQKQISFRKESTRKGKPMSEEHKRKLMEARKRKGE